MLEILDKCIMKHMQTNQQIYLDIVYKLVIHPRYNRNIRTFFTRDILHTSGGEICSDYFAHAQWGQSGISQYRESIPMTTSLTCGSEQTTLYCVCGDCPVVRYS